MARLRKGVAYRRLEGPYTRVSKFKGQAFVKGVPGIKISRFEMGDPKRDFDQRLYLVALKDLQIRHNAIEAARLTSNHFLEKNLVKNYFLKLRVYPFHVLRENPLATGAGADRFSTGMSHSFGKPISSAARIKKGKVIFELRVNKENLKIGQIALKRASAKLPCPCKIVC